MQYWWVNHKQTARQEIEGQYLWSPKFESNGARSEFYNNMRRASPNDLVLSYSNGHLRFVGRVTSFALTAPKPEEFGTVGSYWNTEGWLLPVFWVPLLPPIKPSNFINQLKPFLPAKYSPISQETGLGNQKAYFARVPKSLFDVVLSRTSMDFMLLSSGGSNSLNYDVVNEILDDKLEQSISLDLSLDATTKEATILARRGQGTFRMNVEKIEKSCRLTGISTRSLLIASHIKPWRLCQTGTERLDGNNGLMLTPDADYLFDRGFISFEDNGETKVSSRVSGDDFRRLGFDSLVSLTGFSEASTPWNLQEFNPSQRGYLEFHRSQVFLNIH
jgi:putative restriction endonuclease